MLTEVGGGSVILTQTHPPSKQGTLVEGILPLEGNLHFLRRDLGLQGSQLVVVAANTMYQSHHTRSTNATTPYSHVRFFFVCMPTV